MSNMPMPSYNPDWSQQSGASAPVKPRQIGWAFQLLLAAAVLQVISAVFGVLHASSPEFRQQLSDQLAKSNVPANGPDVVGFSVAAGIATVIVVAVVAVILYIVIGLFINKGHGWARITGLVLAAVSLTQFFGLTFPGGIFTILQVLAGIVAIILCFIMPGSRYFADTKNFKLANKAR